MGGNPINLYDQYGLDTCDNDFCKTSFMDCLSNCIRTYDRTSENYLGDNTNSLLAKGGLSLSGGMVGKKWVGLPRGISGATSVTSLPSIISHSMGGRKTKVGSGLRTMGRWTSRFWLGYGLFMFGAELHCTYACTNYKCSY